MDSYGFELHITNQPNKLITIEANTLMIAYDIACEMYPDVLTIVPTDPTIDLHEESTQQNTEALTQTCYDMNFNNVELIKSNIDNVVFIAEDKQHNTVFIKFDMYDHIYSKDVHSNIWTSII